MSLTSRILDVLGRVFIGVPSMLFGLPSGSLSDLYRLPGNREPLNREETSKPSWMARRVVEIAVRRRMMMPAGVLASALSLGVVLVGLFIIGGVHGAQSILDHFHH